MGTAIDNGTSVPFRTQGHDREFAAARCCRKTLPVSGSSAVTVDFRLVSVGDAGVEMCMTPPILKALQSDNPVPGSRSAGCHACCSRDRLAGVIWGSAEKFTGILKPETPSKKS